MDDLIRREDVLEAINKRSYYFTNAAIDEARKAVLNAPTIKAEPVRHGRWAVNENGHAYCTKCGSTLPLIRCYDEETDREWAEEFPETRFCPHCGAKMDGGDPHD